METEVKMNLPTKLAFLRKQKGLTQLGLAEKLNVSRQAISRWEVGAAVPNIDNLKVLSDLYGVSVDYLLNDNAEDSSKSSRNKVPGPNEQTKSRKPKASLVCVLFLAIVIIVCVTIFQGQSGEQDQVTPIRKMDRMIEDDYPTGTFTFE